MTLGDLISVVLSECAERRPEKQYKKPLRQERSGSTPKVAFSGIDPPNLQNLQNYSAVAQSLEGVFNIVDTVL